MERMTGDCKKRYLLDWQFILPSRPNSPSQEQQPFILYAKIVSHPPSPHHRNLVIVSANIPFKNIGQIVDLILRNYAHMTDAKLLTVNAGCYCFFIYWNLFCIALQMDLIISFQNRQESTIWPELCIHSRNIFVHIIIIFENKSTGIDYCIVYTLKNYKMASKVLVVVSFSVNVLAYCFGEFKVP